MKTKLLMIALSLVFAFALPPLRMMAHEGDEEDAPLKIPATAGDIWYQVKLREGQLAKAIADKKLEQVHRLAFAIRDLVNELPEKSKTLDADKRAKVAMNAKFVAELAKRLDESGDAKNQTATDENFKKLQPILKLVEGQYLPETLTATSGFYTCPMHAEVKSATPAKCPTCHMDLAPQSAHLDHNPKHGGLLGMQGDWHYELVEHGNEFRVFVYDAFTQPVSVKGVKGTIEIGGQPDKIVSLPMTAAAGDTYLVASIPKAGGYDQVTLKLDLPKEKINITLPLRITLQGRIVDVACFARDGEAALQRDHDECARACIASGSPVGFLMGKDEHALLYLVTLKGDKFASKAANEKLIALANQQVQVTGRIIQRDHVRILELSDIQLIKNDLDVK